MRVSFQAHMIMFSILSLFCPRSLCSQTSQDSIKELQSYLREIKQLYSELDKVEREDFVFTKLRAWWIENPELEDSIRSKYFQTMGSTALLGQEEEGKSPFYVVATRTPHSDLVALFSGKNTVKGGLLREFLYKKKENQDLRLQIIEGSSSGRQIELLDSIQISGMAAPRLFKSADTIVNYFDRYAIEEIDHRTSSVFSMRFPENMSYKVYDKWGFEFKLGNEEMNYPFWYSGNSSLLILYKRVKLGAQLPLWIGAPNSLLTGGLWTPRKLDGSYGVHGECDFAYAGGAFLVGARRSDVNGTFVDLPNIYRISLMAQVWYSFTVTINNSKNLIRAKIGGGYHQIARDTMLYTSNGLKSEIGPSSESDHSYWSPYIKCEIMDQHSDDRFGAIFQYYHEWLMTTLWLEILPNHLRVELKGGFPILRSRYVWEPKHVISMNVPLSFSISF